MATSTYLNSLITGSFGSAVATFSDPARDVAYVQEAGYGGFSDRRRRPYRAAAPRNAFTRRFGCAGARGRPGSATARARSAEGCDEGWADHVRAQRGVAADEGAPARPGIERARAAALSSARGRVSALPRLGRAGEIRHRRVPALPRDHGLGRRSLSDRGAAAGEPLAARSDPDRVAPDHR